MKIASSQNHRNSTKSPWFGYFSNTNEKAISIIAAFRDNLIGDSNSAWFSRVDYQLEIPLAISWFAKFQTPGTEMDKIMILNDKLTVKHSSDRQDTIQFIVQNV